MELILAMEKVYEEQKINIELLDLDTHNPRFIDFFDANSTEDDVIEYLLKNEKAKDIVDEINKVQDFYADSHLWVLKRNEKYLVKEGNRRLAAIKALSNPVKYLGGKYSAFEKEELPCLVYDDEQTLDDRIIRKHTQVEIATWSRLAQASYVKRYVTNGGNIKNLHIQNHNLLLKLYNFFERGKGLGYGDDLRKLLEDGKAAIIERFLGNNKITEQLGFSFDKNNNISVSDEMIFKNTIEIFIKWLSGDTKVTAHKINKNNIQEDYVDKHFSENGYRKEQLELFEDAELSESKTEDEGIKPQQGFSGQSVSTENFGVSEKPSLQPEIKEEEQSNKGAQSVSGKSSSTPNSSFEIKKKLLIGLNPTLGLNINAYKNLLDEIQNINFRTFPNASAALLRTFLDCTVCLFLKKIKVDGVLLSEDPQFKNKLLSARLETLSQWIINNKDIKSLLKAIKNEVEYANCVVHLHHFDAGADAVIRFEEKIMPFLTFLYKENGSNIKRSGKK